MVKRDSSTQVGATLVACLMCALGGCDRPSQGPLATPKGGSPPESLRIRVVHFATPADSIGSHPTPEDALQRQGARVVYDKTWHDVRKCEDSFDLNTGTKSVRVELRLWDIEMTPTGSLFFRYELTAARARGSGTTTRELQGQIGQLWISSGPIEGECLAFYYEAR